VNRQWLRHILLSTMILLLAGIGCSGGSGNKEEEVGVRLDAAEASEKVGAAFRNVVTDTQQTLTAVSEGEQFQQLGEALASVSTLLGTGPVTLSPIDGLADPLDRLGSFLVDTVLVETNDQGNGIFTVPSADLCALLLEGQGVEPGAESDCVEQVDSLQLKLQIAELSNGNVRIAVVLGPDDLRLVRLELNATRIGLFLNLAEVKNVLIYVLEESAGAEDGAFDQLFERFNGEVGVSLAFNGENDVTIAAAITEAIDIELASPEDAAQRVTIKSARRDPLIALRAEGDDMRLTTTLDLGLTSVQVPASLLTGDNRLQSLLVAVVSAEPMLSMTLAGITGTLVVDDGDESVHLSNVGLGAGASTITLGNQTLVAIDLNPNSGRSFDLTVTPDLPNRPLAIFDPGVDLRVDLNLSQFPPALLGESSDDLLLEIKLLPGTTPTLQVIDGVGIRVTDGSLTLSETQGSDPADRLTVNDGQCLLPGSGEGDSLIGLFSAGPCAP